MHSEASTNKASKTQRTKYNLDRSWHQQLQVHVEDNLEKQLFFCFMMADISRRKMKVCNDKAYKNNENMFPLKKILETNLQSSGSFLSQTF